MSFSEGVEELNEELAKLRAAYAADRPKSAYLFRQASNVLPGSNTRSVLHFDPFPVYIENGHGAQVKDVDEHVYVDFVGEFSAGLFGHSDPVIADAVRRALDGGIVLGAPNDFEIEFAQLLKSRFPSMEKLRFCNSGTEANLIALATSIAVTGRRTILAFKGAYHGSVLKFSADGGRLNMPFDVVLADFNDMDGTAKTVHENRSKLAAIIVEPILGAGGNIPATSEFIALLRRTATEVGAHLIFDEVKTSRCGAGGMQSYFDVLPDLTTLGKYIGGGLACAAFGGRNDIMLRFDPQSEGGFKHAGTFNNNICAMAAGVAALKHVFTPECADRFSKLGEKLRRDLNADCISAQVPMQFSGFGSFFTVHFTNLELSKPSDIPAISRAIGQLFHMFCLKNGILITSRGDIFMSLPTTAEQKERLRSVNNKFIKQYGDIVRVLARAKN